jgi:cell division protein FtsB
MNWAALGVLIAACAASSTASWKLGQLKASVNRLMDEVKELEKSLTILRKSVSILRRHNRTMRLQMNELQGKVAGQ